MNKIVSMLSIPVWSIVLTLFFCGNTQAADPGSCSSEVKVENTRVTVSPNGVDDTVNLQCALDLAQARGIPDVVLVIGEFYISKLEIADFNGTFRGTRKADTILNVLDDSIDCDAMEDAFRSPSVILFNGGRPEIRTLTLKTNHPCMDGKFLSSVIHFTGEPGDASCGIDVIFALADRLRIEGPGILGKVSKGISAWAEGFFFDSCRNSLNGSVKINRVDILSVFVGVATSMQSGAQVDINLSGFEDTYIGYSMERSNQITSVTSNTFTGMATDRFDYYAVVAFEGISPPDRSRLTVQGNTFNLSKLSSTIKMPFGFASFYGLTSAQLSFLARDNIFNMSDNATGIAGAWFSNGVISNNIFRGIGDVGVLITGELESPDTAANDWAIMGNTFVGLTANRSDIILDFGTSNNVVGSDQTLDVTDNGTGNTVINN